MDYAPQKSMQNFDSMTISWTSMPFLRIFGVLPGWKVFSSRHIGASLPAVSDVFPYRVSLYSFARGEIFNILLTDQV
jgi:hypothetical protein